MPLVLSPYLEQREQWPASGRRILAQFDDDSIVVYQAFRPEIAAYAVSHGHFGGDFSFARMSWIKTSFLWMMYRSGWATKPRQEAVLAIRLRHDAFRAIVAQAVISSLEASDFADEAAWRAAVGSSNVRLQWDPDHEPSGQRVARRAIQLGLRGDILERYGREWILAVEDITPLVVAQRAHRRPPEWPSLLTPREAVYALDEEIVRRLGIDR